MVHSKCNYSRAVTVSGPGARYPPLRRPLRPTRPSLHPTHPSPGSIEPLAGHNWIGQQLTPLRPEQSGTWYFQVVGSNLLLLAAFTENKSHSVNNQLSRVSVSSLCVFVCMFMCIKGCLFQREIQFEESNLIRGHRSLSVCWSGCQRGLDGSCYPRSDAVMGLGGWPPVHRTVARLRKERRIFE